MSDKYIGYKIKLYPTKDQMNLFDNYFNACRYVYNLGIALCDQYYNEAIENNYDFKSISFITLNNRLNELKSKEEYYWLKEFDSTSLKLVLKDVIHAYKKFFKGLANKPKFKKKKYYSAQFPIRSERLMINKNNVRISSIGNIYSKNNKNEIIGYGSSESKSTKFIAYKSSRIYFDGVDYWLSFEIPENEQMEITTNSRRKFSKNKDWLEKDFSKPVGIDLGCKGNNWIVASNGMKETLPNTIKEDKKIRKFKKQFSRQMGTKTKSTKSVHSKENDRYSNNQLKTLKKLNKYYKKRINKKKDAIYKFASKLVETKPSAVVLEDLYPSEMVQSYKNRDSTTNKMVSKYSSQVYNSCLRTVRNIITNTVSSNNIPVIIAPRNYKSSQICSVCGHVYNIGKNNIYKCPNCGVIIDRDLNAAYNLENLAYN